jgi:hypothetical protein
MSVRALFFVAEKDLRQWGTIVRLRVVTKGDEEEKAFFAATPVGLIEMTIKNEVAAEQFEFGKEFYVTFDERVSTSS